MSSPIHHAEDLDEALHYAPPWARENALRDPEQPELTEPAQRRYRIGAGRNEYSGDLAMAKLQRQLSLSPDAVPEPPHFDGARSLWPIVLRLFGVGGFAAAVAWFTISPNSHWLRGEGTLADAVQSDVQAPAIVAATEKTVERDPLSTPEARGLLLQHGLAQAGATQQVAEASPSAAPEAAREAVPAPVAVPAPDTEPPSNDAPVAPAASLGADEIATLLKRGQDMLGTGDFAAARLLLRRAADAGSADAAMALATTFDPLVLHRLGAIGVAPDTARARKWYGKAAALGSSAAALSLSQLSATAQ